MEIAEIINRIYPLPQAAMQRMQACVAEVTFPKGHMLLKANRVEQVMYFIKKGIVRAFSEYEESEITFWFGREGDPVLSMKSYVEKEKGYEHIELLEECTLYEIETAHLEQLFNEDIHIANWGRRLAEKELIKTEERFISRQCRTATERYKELIKESPHLLQRVQLGHIASYLGITQVSLSRIRAEIR
jgi:CRP-like cAMP-binding protein